jgi:hypothetical protein
MGKACADTTDCVAGAVCTAGLCAAPAPTCSDGIKNGAETDVDCGGATCGQCAQSKACLVATDCAGGAECLAGACGAPVGVAIAGAPYGATRVRLGFAADQFTPASFTVYRSASAGLLGSAVATALPGSTTEYWDTGLPAGTASYYTVTAAGPQGTVSSTQLTLTTGPAAAFPEKPTGFLAAWVPPDPRSVSAGFVNLSWDPYPGATSYAVYRTPVAELIGNQQFAQLVGTTASTAMEDHGFVKGVIYYHFVIAQDTVSVPNRTSQPTAVASQAPGAPLLCERAVVDTVSSGGDTVGFRVYFWGGANAQSHHVYVSADPAAITPATGGTSAPLDSLPITQVRPGYYLMRIPWASLASFGVGATVYAAVEEWSSISVVRPSSTQYASAVVRAPPTTTVTDLTVERRNPTTVRLNWTPPTGLAALHGYDIYRMTSPTDPSPTLVGGGVAGPPWDDTTVAPATGYTYRVDSLVKTFTIPSNLASVTTNSDWAPLLSPPISVPFNGKALLGWVAFNDGTSFNVYGGTSLNPFELGTFLSTPLSPVISTYQDLGMTFYGTTLYAPADQLLTSRLSLYLLKDFGMWAVAEVYPDGTEGPKAVSLPVILY